MSITINPQITTNARGSFGVQSNGLMQGMVMADPVARFRLVGGVLADDELLPMWGGVAIYENVPVDGINPLGGLMGRATSIASTKPLTGFSTFDQAYNGISSPQSPVPLLSNGQSVNAYRLGSGARIAVKCDPSLVSLDGTPINSQVSWDFNTQNLAPYVASGTTIALSSVTWANTAGGRLTCVAASAIPYGLGDTVNISGATNSGTGGAAAINKSFVIDGFVDSTHFTLAAPAAAGVYATIAGSPVLNIAGGALACKILQVQTTGCYTVDYDPVTGFATWNRNGCAALIQI